MDGNGVKILRFSHVFTKYFLMFLRNMHFDVCFDAQLTNPFPVFLLFV